MYGHFRRGDHHTVIGPIEFQVHKFGSLNFLVRNLSTLWDTLLCPWMLQFCLIWCIIVFQNNSNLHNFKCNWEKLRSADNIFECPSIHEECQGTREANSGSYRIPGITLVVHVNRSMLRIKTNENGMFMKMHKCSVWNLKLKDIKVIIWECDLSCTCN